ncbi:hypothetical protein L6452_44099 [Arctium lappa]|uniref:Uncharacterized protein n=1 Tax=Arctium lappa TaxID=4217 RepID=A0ACB8XFJ6_ARCLA|nr:hypothetical protein L6452_44099 [Arctium lappa]
MNPESVLRAGTRIASSAQKASSNFHNPNRLYRISRCLRFTRPLLTVRSSFHNSISSVHSLISPINCNSQNQNPSNKQSLFSINYRSDLQIYPF